MSCSSVFCGVKAWLLRLLGMTVCRCMDVAGMSERATRRYRCTGCLQGRYCSKTCQREAWWTHRGVCADVAA